MFVLVYDVTTYSGNQQWYGDIWSSEVGRQTVRNLDVIVSLKPADNNPWCLDIFGLSLLLHNQLMQLYYKQMHIDSRESSD